MLQFCRNRLKIETKLQDIVIDIGTNPLLLVVNCYEWSIYY